MISLTRLNHVPLVLNSDLIEHIEATPDTVITLTTGQILRVRESPEDVVERIVDFRRRIFGPEAQPQHLCNAGECDGPRAGAGLPGQNSQERD